MDKQLAIDLASFRTLEKLGYKYNGGEYWKPPLSTIGADKPVFTQAMKEAGELPSVGMECYIDGTLVIYTIVLVGDSEGDFILTPKEGDKYWQRSNVKYLKPLIPPIELIDGKAYQFDVVMV